MPLIASRAGGSATSFGGLGASLTPPYLGPFGAYDSIATTTVGSGGVASVSFTSIPATYTHLQVRGTYRIPGNVVYLNITTSAGVNYGLKKHYIAGGNGTGVYNSSEAPSSGNGLNLDVYVGGSLPANIFSGFVLDILDYANTGKYKTIRHLGGYPEADSTINFISGFYDVTNAITGLQFKGSSTIPEYSKFALYGIKGA